MKTNSKDGKVTFELLKPERKRIESARQVIAGMSEYTKLAEKAKAADEAIAALLKEFDAG